MVNRAGMICVTAHVCRFGMSGRDQHGSVLVLKPNKFLTDCLAIAAALNRQCIRGHRHISTLNARGFAQFAIYPPALCHAISRGLARQLKADTRTLRVPRDDFPLLALCKEDAQDTEELVALALEDQSDEKRVDSWRSTPKVELSLCRWSEKHERLKCNSSKIVIYMSTSLPASVLRKPVIHP